MPGYDNRRKVLKWSNPNYGNGPASRGSGGLVSKFHFPNQESVASVHGKNNCARSVSPFRMRWSWSVYFYLEVDFALNDLVVKVAVKFAVSCFPWTLDKHVIRYLVEVKCLVSQIIFLKFVGCRRR